MATRGSQQALDNLQGLFKSLALVETTTDAPQTIVNRLWFEADSVVDDAIYIVKDAAPALQHLNMVMNSRGACCDRNKRLRYRYGSLERNCLYFHMMEDLLEQLAGHKENVVAPLFLSPMPDTLDYLLNNAAALAAQGGGATFSLVIPYSPSCSAAWRSFSNYLSQAPNAPLQVDMQRLAEAVAQAYVFPVGNLPVVGTHAVGNILVNLVATPDGDLDLPTAIDALARQVNSSFDLIISELGIQRYGSVLGPLLAAYAPDVPLFAVAYDPCLLETHLVAFAEVIKEDKLNKVLQHPLFSAIQDGATNNQLSLTYANHRGDFENTVPDGKWFLRCFPGTQGTVDGVVEP
eukprot:TRINITY_DN96986_c0_g1_i1.p1 TRINITY_DN96986_c0_g1~~TRINITY_DN96986_c0_g1_i1.p1  ORF type:complete len:348 (-),score=28.62 TRINITY_DN96986_c0_g1_i1:169-1212(-)